SAGEPGLGSGRGGRGAGRQGLGRARAAAAGRVAGGRASDRRRRGDHEQWWIRRPARQAAAGARHGAMTGTARELPLFPLNTVLFPGGPLPLRIFEPRYLDMVSRCLREQTGFAVVMLTVGEETREAASFAATGTEAMIVDFDRLED